MGISGPRFLAIYAVLLALTVLVAAIDRRRRTGGPVPVDPGMPLDAYEVAVLNGGEQLAATAAVANLRKAGALRVDGDSVEPAGPLPPGAHPVERAVYDSVLRGERRRAGFVPVLARNVGELGEIRGRLVQLGLLWDRGRARSMRALLLWFVPVLGLGLARLAAGLANDRPVEFLVVLLLVTVGLALGMSKPPSGRTRAGSRLLDGLRKAGPQAGWAGGALPLGLAAGSIALLGVHELWNEDAELASALGINRVAGGAGAGGGVSGCSGSSCGGGGGCGGGGCGG